MKAFRTKLHFVVLLALAATAPHSSASDTPAPIGVYDSRSVAIAYAGSSHLKKDMQALKDQLRQVQTGGDQTAAARLQQEGIRMQVRLHRQGFGTAPVDDLLARIPEATARVRDANAVTALVSKWDSETLARHAGAPQVDVTESLVDAFQPADKSRRDALAVRKRQPVADKDLMPNP